MEWDWEFAWSILPQLLAGFRITLIATALGAVVAAVLGLVFAILRRSRNRILSRGTGFVVDTSAGAIRTRRLVVATGGKSIPKIGATGLAYDIAAQFGLRLVETRAVGDVALMRYALSGRCPG